MSRSHKENIGKLFGKYFADHTDHVVDERKFFLELPPEVILTVGDVLNIVKNRQSIDVIEPQRYNTVSTLTPNSYMFENCDNSDPFGYFYADFCTERRHDYEEAVQHLYNYSADLGDVWHPCITAYEECKKHQQISKILKNRLVDFLDETRKRREPEPIFELIIEFLDLCEEERINCFLRDNIVDPYSVWVLSGSGGDVWIKANEDLWSFLKKEQGECDCAGTDDGQATL